MQPIQRITFADHHTVLYVDTSELRGRYLTTVGGISQPAVTSFWRRAVQQWQPTIALDVGMNYGEIIFSTHYASGTQIVGIEANPLLRPCIQQSLAAHPNRRQMTIVCALASDQQQQAVPFYVDRNWSGTSTAVPLHTHRQIEKHAVDTITVDSLFADRPLTADRLLFKIDVEGYEQHVLAGMKRLLDGCAAALGLIECNTSFLQKAGVDVPRFLERLQRDFCVYVLAATDRLLQFPRLSAANLCRYFGKPEVECNLVLSTKREKRVLEGYQILSVSLP